MSSLASVSIDLDAVALYHRIHALPGAPSPQTEHLILRSCLPRFVALFDRHAIKATLFVVGHDLERDAEGRELLARLARDGHELASHSFSHPYDLTRLGPHVITQEIDRAHEAITRVAGVAPLGFRAPGYEVNASVLEVLCRLGYRYDSSAFSSVPYYAAKAAVMAGLRLLGRRSGSILGSPRALLAPTIPYRPSQADPYRRGTLPIVELPMAVTPRLRLPVIGTSVVTAPEPLRRLLVRAALERPFFNFELHGIDLADAAGDGFSPALVARQPDLRLPLERKLDALDATLKEMKASGARIVPLRTAAELVAT